MPWWQVVQRWEMVLSAPGLVTPSPSHEPSDPSAHLQSRLIPAAHLTQVVWLSWQP